MNKFFAKLVTYIGAYLTTFIFLELTFFLVLLIADDDKFTALEVLETAFKSSFALTLISYFIFSYIMHHTIAESSYTKIMMFCKHFEKNNFWRDNNMSGHWWDLHDTVSNFNYLNKMKYYTAPYTYVMNQGKELVYDTTFILWHMHKEIDILNALSEIKDIKKRSNRPIDLYDNCLFERKLVVKNRWELFLKNLDKDSFEYSHLLKRYNQKFKVKEDKKIEQKPQITETKVKPSLDHINQDLMKQEL